MSVEGPKRVPDTIDISLVEHVLDDLSKDLAEASRVHAAHWDDHEKGYMEADPTGLRTPMEGEKLAAFQRLSNTIEHAQSTRNDLIAVRTHMENVRGKYMKMGIQAYKEGTRALHALREDLDVARRLLGP